VASDDARLKFEYEALERLASQGVYGCRGRPERADNRVWDCTIVGPHQVAVDPDYLRTPKPAGQLTGTEQHVRTREFKHYKDAEIEPYREEVASPYEDELLRLKLIFPEAYPKYPPRAYFCQEVYHPSVAVDGLVGLTILDAPQIKLSESVVKKKIGDRFVGTWGMGMDWTEETSIAKILKTIQDMLSDPDDRDHDCVVLNEEAMTMAHYSRDQFDDKVRQVFKESKDYVRVCKEPPLAPAVAAAKKANEHYTPQIEAMKKKYGLTKE